MKIKASQIKPGMVISTNRKWRRKEIENIFLVTATKGKVNVEYTHLNFQDAYGGLMVGSIDGEQEVRVIKGEKRKFIIEEITKDVFRNLRDIENVIDTLKLIEAMEGK